MDWIRNKPCCLTIWCVCVWNCIQRFYRNTIALVKYCGIFYDQCVNCDTGVTKYDLYKFLGRQFEWETHTNKQTKNVLSVHCMERRFRCIFTILYYMQWASVDLAKLSEATDFIVFRNEYPLLCGERPTQTGFQPAYNIVISCILAKGVINVK